MQDFLLAVCGVLKDSQMHIEGVYKVNLRKSHTSQ